MMGGTAPTVGTAPEATAPVDIPPPPTDPSGPTVPPPPTDPSGPDQPSAASLAAGVLTQQAVIDASRTKYALAATRIASFAI